MFLVKVVLKTCSKFKGEHPCWSMISIKLFCHFIEITIWHWCSPVNLLRIFRTPFLKNISGRLLLGIVLYLLYKDLNIRLIYDGTIPIFNSSYNARFYFFIDWEAIYFLKINRTYVRPRGVDLSKYIWICCVLPEAFVFYWVEKTMASNLNQNGVELKICHRFTT